MAVTARPKLELVVIENRTTLLSGTSVAPHRLVYPHALVNGGLDEFASGTGSYQQDLVYEFGESLVATTRTFDLHTSLSMELGGAIFSPIEVTGIWIFNDALVAGKPLIIGNAASPAFAGLFPTSTYTLKVAALGCFVWEAPIRGDGIVVTQTTADGFKVDAGANTVPYRVIFRGRSA